MERAERYARLERVVGNDGLTRHEGPIRRRSAYDSLVAFLPFDSACALCAITRGSGGIEHDVLGEPRRRLASEERIIIEMRREHAMVSSMLGPSALRDERAHARQFPETADWVLNRDFGRAVVRVHGLKRREEVDEHAHVLLGERRIWLAAEPMRNLLFEP